jgi:hypothetical protein
VVRGQGREAAGRGLAPGLGTGAGEVQPRQRGGGADEKAAAVRVVEEQDERVVQGLADPPDGMPQQARTRLGEERFEDQVVQEGTRGGGQGRMR